MYRPAWMCLTLLYVAIAFLRSVTVGLLPSAMQLLRQDHLPLTQVFRVMMEFPASVQAMSCFCFVSFGFVVGFNLHRRQSQACLDSHHLPSQPKDKQEWQWCGPREGLPGSEGDLGIFNSAFSCWSTDRCGWLWCWCWFRRLVPWCPDPDATD